MKLSSLGEFGLINKIQSQLPLINKSDVIQGIGDDAAIMRTAKNKQLVATIDTLIENVHFSMDYYSFYDLGWKSLAVNLSDIAAMGGNPKYALISLGLPSSIDSKNIDEFYRGMKFLQKKYSVDIIGGDTVYSPKGIYITVAVLGEINPKKILYRSGATEGDLILATGEFGGALDDQKHRRSLPRIIEGQIIAESGYATAMMDDSDGLARSIHEICRQSKVGAKIFEELIPKAKGADLNNALNGGEDFELIFTCKEKYADKIRKAVMEKTGTKVSIIGGIVGKKYGIKIIDKNEKSKKLEIGGYEHFK